MSDSTDTAQQFAFQAVRDTLGKSTDVDACVALTSRLDTLIDQAVEFFQKDGAGIACRAGCNFCCHLRVMVYPHEAIALFRYLGSRMSREQAEGVRARIVANAAQIAKSDQPTSLACAFLQDGKCSAYEARPSACSGYHSLSKERCEAGFQNGGATSDGIPMSGALRHVAASMNEGTEEGLHAAGLSGEPVELHTALAALMRNPACVERWRSGRGLVRK